MSNIIATETEVERAIEQHYAVSALDVERLPKTKFDTFRAVVGREKADRFVKVGTPFDSTKYGAQIQIAGMLSAGGVPVPEVIQTTRGDSYVSIGEGDIGKERFLEMHAWVPNAGPYEMCVGEIEQIARAMAQMHNVADSLDQGHSAIELLATGGYTGVVKGHPFPNASLMQDFEGRMGEVPEVLRPSLTRDLVHMRAALLPEGDMPGQDVGIIHADVCAPQTMFDLESRNLLALIDWEWMLHGPRARDIGYAVYRLADTDDAGEREQLGNAFMRAYLDARPEFPTDDLEAIQQHLAWDATCRRSRNLLGLLDMDDPERKEARAAQLVGWWNDYSLERMATLADMLQ